MTDAATTETYSTIKARRAEKHHDRETDITMRSGVAVIVAVWIGMIWLLVGPVQRHDVAQAHDQWRDRAAEVIEKPAQPEIHGNNPDVAYAIVVLRYKDWNGAIRFMRRAVSPYVSNSSSAPLRPYPILVNRKGQTWMEADLHRDLDARNPRATDTWIYYCLPIFLGWFFGLIAGIAVVYLLLGIFGIWHRLCAMVILTWYFARSFRFSRWIIRRRRAKSLKCDHRKRKQPPPSAILCIAQEYLGELEAMTPSGATPTPSVAAATLQTTSLIELVRERDDDRARVILPQVERMMAEVREHLELAE